MSVIPGRELLRASPESITTPGVMDSGPAPRGASRNDDQKNLKSCALPPLTTVAYSIARNNPPATKILRLKDCASVLLRRDRFLDRRSDVNRCLWICSPRRRGDQFRIRALVMCRRTHDGVERRRQQRDNLFGLLVARDADNQNPVRCSMNCLQACQRLPDAVGCVTDIDDHKRIARDEFKPAGPTRVAKARPHSGFYQFESSRACRLPQPKQK